MASCPREVEWTYLQRDRLLSYVEAIPAAVDISRQAFSKISIVIMGGADDCRPPQVALAYFISTVNKLSSSIKPSSSSPTTHSPTPAGVPVKTRSPIFTEK